MLVFSSTDMLFKDDQQDTEATAIASDLLSGKKRWQASFGLEERTAEKTPVRLRIVVSARLLGFGYQRLMPSFAGVRFEMGNDGWHSFVALNDESASVDASFDFTPVWNSMPAGASFCVAVPRGCAGMKTQNCKPRCLSVSLMALPNRRNCQGNCLRKILVRTKAKRQKVFCR